MRRLLTGKPFLITLGIVVLYTIAGFWLAPYLMHRQLVGYVADTLGRRLQVDKIRVNPYLFKIEVRGLSLAEANGKEVLAFDRLLVDFAAKSLFRWAWTFSSVELVRPRLHLDVDPDGRLNLARMVDEAAPSDAPAPAPAPEKNSMPRIAVVSLRLDNGRVVFTDRSDPTPAETMVTPVNLTVKDLTTLPNRKGPLELRASLAGGGQMMLSGTVSLQPLTAEGHISLANLKPGSVWQFLQDELNMAEPRGRVFIAADYRFAMENGSPQLVMTNGHYRAADLALSLKGADTPALVLAAAELTGGRYDLADNRVTAERMTFADGRLDFATDGQGRFNWAELFSGPQRSPDETLPVSTDASPRRDLTIDIRSFGLENIALDYEDRSRAGGLSVTLGRIDSNGAFLMEQRDGDLKMGTDVSDLAVADASLRREGLKQDLVRLPEARLDQGEVDISRGQVRLGRIELSGGQLTVERMADGGFNWQRRTGEPVPDAAVASEENETTVQDDAAPWHVRADGVELTGFSVALTDRTLPDPVPVQLRDIRLALEGVDTEGGETDFTLALASGTGGRLTAAGTAALVPVQVQASLTLDKLDLRPLQPYLDRAARLQLSSGWLNASGDAAYGVGDALPSFSGRLGIIRLQLTPEDSFVPLAGWASAAMEGISLDGGRGGLSVERIRLEQPFGELVIDSNQALNVSHLAVARPSGDAPTESPEKPPGERIPVSVKRIDISGGRLLFSDLSLPVPFKADIHELRGVISGLSSEPASRVALSLDGRVQDYGEVTINGELKPFDPKAFTDVGMAFRNLEMTDLTPYTAKFAGRRIRSGKLSLDLTYKVNQSRLLGENQIVMDRLELGERVESRKAMDLPLELALALLEDADGRIDIGLPVSGDLENPQFSFGHLVWKALANFLTKVVSAPFRALGALMGLEDKNLDAVGFAAGRAELPPSEAEKLAAIADGLGRRPQLRLVVRGGFDPLADALAIRDLALRREVVAAAGIQLADGEDPGPVAFGDNAVRQAIASLTARRLTAAQLLELGIPDVPPETGGERPVPAASSAILPDVDYAAAYRRLLQTIEVSESDLLSLAARRATAIRAALSGAAVAAERISIAEPVETGSETSQVVPCPLELTVGGTD